MPTPTPTAWWPTMSDVADVIRQSMVDAIQRDLVLAASIGSLNGKCLVKIKRLHPSAMIPSYATDGSGCFDITAVECVEQKDDTATYRTGLAFEIPQSKVMILYGRSGYAFNRSLRLATCTSVIDSDFRGELLVKVRRDDGGIWYPSAGDRIAQAMIVDAPHVKFVEVDELSDTKRGDGGFGHTG